MRKLRPLRFRINRCRFARLDIAHHRGKRLRARDCVLGGAFLNRVGLGCAFQIELKQVCKLGMQLPCVENQIPTEYAGLVSPAYSLGGLADKPGVLTGEYPSH